MPQPPEKIPTLSAAGQSRLAAALADAVERAADGLTPDEALAKAAAAAGVPVGHLPVMVRAYNAGRVEAHRKEAASVLDAAADVELADAGRVRDLLYPPEAELAKEARARSASPCRDYDGPPDWPAPAATKSAALDAAAEPPAEPSRKVVWKRACREVEHCQREYGRLRDAAHDRLEELRGALAKLAGYFRRPEALSFAEVSGNVGRVFGPAGRAMVDGLARALAPGLRKDAGDRFEPVRLDREPYSLAADCLRRAEACAAAEGRLKSAGVELAGRAAAALDPFLRGRVGGSPVLAPEAVKFAGAADFGMGVLLRQTWDKVPNPSREELERGVLEKLTDPEHELKIRDANAQATLADTMARMPQLRSEDPALVADAYNDLSVLAPRSVGQPLVLQHVLADRASQRGLPMAPDQIDKLLDIEKGLSPKKDVLQDDNKD